MPTTAKITQNLKTSKRFRIEETESKSPQLSPFFGKMLNFISFEEKVCLMSVKEEKKSSSSRNLKLSLDLKTKATSPSKRGKENR
jgi:hypothetical protein